MENKKSWQLKMFKKTLKKQQRFNELSNLLMPLSPDSACLLVTCGDNNGAMNYYLRKLGGRWSWAELETQSISEMSALLGEPVLLGTFEHLPFQDSHFDRIVSIDCLEHIEDPEKFSSELYRIAKNNAQIIITVPGGDLKKIANRVKEWIGMRKEDYGHVRDGYTVEEVSQIMIRSGIEPVKDVTFSKFFTEFIELGINFLYVKVLSKKNNSQVKQGTIAPATQDQLRAIEKQYKAYAMIYPVFAAISALDNLLFGCEGYVTLVEGKKDE